LPTPESDEPTEDRIRIAAFIEQHRDAIIAEWIAAADALTPRELSTDELRDAVHEILASSSMLCRPPTWVMAFRPSS
jgi:hypothetical protein